MLRNIRSMHIPGSKRAVESAVVTNYMCPARFLGPYVHSDLYIILRESWKAELWLWRFVSPISQNWASIRDLRISGIAKLHDLDKDISSLEDIADGYLLRIPETATVEEFHAYFSEYPTVQEACAS